jgi:hypothetical protein
MMGLYTADVEPSGPYSQLLNLCFISRQLLLVACCEYDFVATRNVATCGVCYSSVCQYSQLLLFNKLTFEVVLTFLQLSAERSSCVLVEL